MIVPFSVSHRFRAQHHTVRELSKQIALILALAYAFTTGMTAIRGLADGRVG
jgi:hypothetical protein